ncbi:MAG: NAD(P)/FAD-dependent oxidoreductase [Bacteroidota bacterium]
MPASSPYDVTIVGSGPNGLSAGIALAQQGLSVQILEAKSTIGGGTRTLELTEPGFHHDVCSAVHPTAAGSPFFSTLPLQEYGLEWVHPTHPVVHPLDGGEAFVASQSLEETLSRISSKEARLFKALFNPWVERWPDFSKEVFGTLRSPRHITLMMKFGLLAMQSAFSLSNKTFETEALKAYFAGQAAHSILPLQQAFTASFGLVLGTSVHAVGWPIARQGSQSIADALAGYFTSLGGIIHTQTEVQSVDDITSAVVLFDVTPLQIVQLCGKHLSPGYHKQLLNFSYGAGAFKIDYSLDEPIPWTNKEARKAGTLHLGGTLEEITASEQAVWDGKHPHNPYVLLSQPSVFDHTRAPEGKHTLWAYCHVPHGSTKDMSSVIEDQIERFAPGFKDIIRTKHSMNTADFQSYNANYIGGDINGGAQYVKQLIGRPVFAWNPYKIPGKSWYICSSSTPPGGGVHGMCGYNAAKSALHNEFGIRLV